MKKLTHFLTLLLIILTVFSCSKSDIISESISNKPIPDSEKTNQNKSLTSSQNSYTYFIDNKEVDEAYHNEQVSSELIVRSFLFTSKINDDMPSAMTMHSFSDIVLALEFSEKYGLRLDDNLRFEDEAEIIAEEYDVENYFKEHGSVPEKYSVAINELYIEIFGAPEKIATFLRKGCSGGGLPANGTIWFMPPGWNNKLSSHEFLGLTGTISLYDKWRFKKFMITIVGGGFTTYCYTTGNTSPPSPFPFDNKTTSLITYSL